MNNNTAADTFATVETEDGEVYIGCIVPIDNYTFKMETGLRGRPVVLHMSQVVEVLPVNKSNPHIA